MSVLLGSLEAASFPSDLIILDRVQAIFVRLFGFTILDHPGVAFKAGEEALFYIS
jgi:hypothetical protein